MSNLIIKEWLGKSIDKKEKYNKWNINFKKIKNIQKHKENLKKKAKKLEIYKKKINKINKNVIKKIKKYS